MNTKTRFSTTLFKPQLSLLFKQQFLNSMTKWALSLRLGSAFCTFPSGSLFLWVLCTFHRTYKYLHLATFFFKTRSHSIIYTFKNYFTTVFSVLSFQFQQNKFYPNRPLKLEILRVQARKSTNICTSI